MESGNKSAETKVTSESRVGISPQPKESCPLVDEAVGIVEQCQREIRGYERLDEAGLRDLISSIERELSELVGFRGQGKIESIRKANVAIREWGQQWKEQALEWEPEEETT